MDFHFFRIRPVGALNTAALNATRGHRRIQVNHADLMADPVGTVRQLQEKLEELGVAVEYAIGRRDSSLYRPFVIVRRQPGACPIESGPAKAA